MYDIPTTVMSMNTLVHLYTAHTHICVHMLFMGLSRLTGKLSLEHSPYFVKIITAAEITHS